MRFLAGAWLACLVLIRCASAQVAGGAISGTVVEPPNSTGIQIFSQNLAPVPTGGALTSTSTRSRQIQFAIKFIW